MCVVHAMPCVRSQAQRKGFHYLRHLGFRGMTCLGRGWDYSPALPDSDIHTPVPSLCCLPVFFPPSPNGSPSLLRALTSSHVS